MAIEEPEYTVVSKNSNYEIRQYGPINVAETKVELGFEVDSPFRLWFLRRNEIWLEISGL